MDLRGRRRWQALRPSPQRFRSSSGFFHFDDNDRSACQKIHQLVMSNPARIPWLHTSDSDSSYVSKTKSYPSSFGKLSSFLTKLRNMTSTYQEYYSEYT
jgi:hypothetical protein